MDVKVILNINSQQVGKHILSGFSMSTISLFRNAENKHDEVKIV